MKTFYKIVVIIFLWCHTATAESVLPPCQGEDSMQWTNCYGSYNYRDVTDYILKKFPKMEELYPNSYYTENYDGEFLMNPTHNKNDIQLIEEDIILNKFSTLGCDTVLFPGSIIPIGTILGSKSLYTGKKKLDDWSIYAGNPLKFFRKRNKESELLSKKYV